MKLLARALPTSLFSRMALTFLIVLLSLAALQYLLLRILWLQAVVEREQRVNWGLADAYARQLRRALESPNDADLYEEVYRVGQLNPEADIFVIDTNGRLLFPLPRGVRKSDRFVDIEPVRRFTTLSFDRSLPIWGDNPRVRGEKTVFSAAPITFKGKDAYMYVLIRSKVTSSSEQALEGYYLMVGGLMTSGGLVLASFAVGSLLFYFVTRRFRLLITTVQRVAEGSFEERIPDAGDDELGQLARAINRMADTIVSSLRRVEETDSLRRDLVANISHDIGGPLSSIRGYTEMLANEKERLSPQGKADLDAISRNIGSVLKLFSELSELSKLEAHETRPQREPLDLIDLLQKDVLPQFAPLGALGNVALRAEHPDRLPPVDADPGMIKRVLQNLIENGINYNRPGGEVVVTLRDQDRMVTISVRDNGPGIRSADLPNIFKRFYRSELAEVTAKKGSGLGLAIVAKMLEMHGSEVTVSTREGEGAEFTFSLPIHRLPQTS